MNGEILRLVDTLHRDKDIDKELIFQGVEACILSAVRKKLGESEEIRVAIDRDSGEASVYEGEERIPISDLGRLAALQGKQVLFQKIREAERDKIFDEYEHKIGKLVTGIVQRAEGPNLIVNLGNGKVEGILPRGDQAPGERFRVGERIKVLVRDVRKNHRVKITLSRSSPDFVRALFELEVPEIAEKVIEIMAIVREPGYRTKIAVTTYDHNVDCVGACVGVRGSRIKNIVDELFGEKIDIVRWNESIEVLIMNALKPAEITSMDLDYETSRASVYVRSDQQSLAIGKRGQNVRLASKLSKWELDIVTVSEEDIEKLRKGETPGVEQDDAEVVAGDGADRGDVAPLESAVVDSSAAGEEGDPAAQVAAEEDQAAGPSGEEVATAPDAEEATRTPAAVEVDGVTDEVADGGTAVEAETPNADSNEEDSEPSQAAPAEGEASPSADRGPQSAFDDEPLVEAESPRRGPASAAPELDALDGGGLDGDAQDDSAAAEALLKHEGGAFERGAAEGQKDT